MSIKELIEKSDLDIPKEKIMYDEPMKKHTTFRIGGPAECLIKIDKVRYLKEILNFANENNLKITVLGNGSNVLVSDDGIKGITLINEIEKIEINGKLYEDFKKSKNLNDLANLKELEKSKIELNEKEKNKNENENKNANESENEKAKANENENVKIVLGAGEKLGKLGVIFLNNELTGFEELAAIPGTIGGATRMNAGANGREMKDIIKSVRCVDYCGNEKTFTNEEMKFGYRYSILKEEKYIVIEVEIELEKGNKEQIKSKMDMYREKRLKSQPLEYPSAGSTFKRGNDFITAKLIDEAGLKGLSVGGASISTKHAGFVINKGDATAKDVLELTTKVKEEVYKKFNKKIEFEIEFLK